MNGLSPILHEIFETGIARETDAVPFMKMTGISIDYAQALYSTILAEKPAVVLEIGMAQGISSLAIISALLEIGSGKLISIDPFQSTQWANVGLDNVKRAGGSDQHELIENFDYFALPQLLERGIRIDFAYIDGWHTFDYTLLDFFFIDKLLNQNGIVAFNDCGFPPVKRVLKWLGAHRKYNELAVLKPDYKGRNFALTAFRFLFRLSRSDRYFRKLEDWEPAWNYYAPFWLKRGSLPEIIQRSLVKYVYH